MKFNKDTRIIAIIAILTGSLALTIGFANYTLDITRNKNTNNSTNLDSFDVSLSINEESPIVGDVVGVSKNSANATTAKLTKNSITNLKATFTEPNQSVSYSFYAINTWEKDVFLKTISYLNLPNGKFKKCTPTPETTEQYVESACESINVTVTFDKERYTSTKANITSHILPSNFSEKITVTISYDEDGTRSDGPFEVQFGDIALTYSMSD